MTAPLLEVDGLGVEAAVEGRWIPLVDDVTFSIGRSEIVGLVGESGSGKSITSRSLIGLFPEGIRLNSGQVRLHGQDVTQMQPRALEDLRGNRISMIFQEPMTSLNPAYKVGEQIAETVRRHDGATRQQARARAVELLDLVGIPQAVRQVDSYPHQFSGGMRQRVMIAIALACNPELLIADEPTTALDVTIQAQILDLLREIRERLGTAILFVTHDLGVVADICDRVLVMYSGQLVETARVESLFARPRHPYTAALLEAAPDLTGRGTLTSIPGVPPSPGGRPEACRFAPRCGWVVDGCLAAPIPLDESAEGHRSRCLRSNELPVRGAL